MEIHPTVARQMMLESVQAKRQLRRSIKARAQSGLCLIEGCCEKAKQRGLCTRHVQRFYQLRRAAGTNKAKAEMETKCIREGLILPRGKQRQMTADDPFSKVVLSAG